MLLIDKLIGDDQGMPESLRTHIYAEVLEYHCLNFFTGWVIANQSVIEVKEDCFNHITSFHKVMGWYNSQNIVAETNLVCKAAGEDRREQPYNMNPGASGQIRTAVLTPSRNRTGKFVDGIQGKLNPMFKVEAGLCPFPFYPGIAANSSGTNVSKGSPSSISLPGR